MSNLNLPWEVIELFDGVTHASGKFGIHDSSGKLIIRDGTDINGDDNDFDKESAEIVVDCVNALAGRADPAGYVKKTEDANIKLLLIIHPLVKRGIDINNLDQWLADNDELIAEAERNRVDNTDLLETNAAMKATILDIAADMYEEVEMGGSERMSLGLDEWFRTAIKDIEQFHIPGAAKLLAERRIATENAMGDQVEQSLAEIPVKLVRANIEHGQVDLILKHPVVGVIASELGRFFIEAGATNNLLLTLYDHETIGTFNLTIQREGRPERSDVIETLRGIVEAAAAGNTNADDLVQMATEGLVKLGYIEQESTVDDEEGRTKTIEAAAERGEWDDIRASLQAPDLVDQEMDRRLAHGDTAYWNEHADDEPENTDGT